MANRIVLVEWRDCTHYDDSHMTKLEASSESLIIMHTVGHLIAEDAERITLGMEYIPEQERWRHISWIPKVNVIRKRVVKFSA